MRNVLHDEQTQVTEQFAKEKKVEKGEKVQSRTCDERAKTKYCFRELISVSIETQFERALNAFHQINHDSNLIDWKNIFLILVDSSIGSLPNREREGERERRREGEKEREGERERINVLIQVIEPVRQKIRLIKIRLREITRR